MKFTKIVFIVLAIGIIVIHIDSLLFPHSILLRHILLLFFIGTGVYYAYESKRKHLEEYSQLKKFIRVCSWCKNVCITDPDTLEYEWISFEKYISLEHKTRSPQGKCPHCYDLIHKNRYGVSGDIAA
jgi:ABC-type polysaccharide/polyol phosphate export permease